MNLTLISNSTFLLCNWSLKALNPEFPSPILQFPPILRTSPLLQPLQSLSASAARAVCSPTPLHVSLCQPPQPFPPPRSCRLSTRSMQSRRACRSGPRQSSHSGPQLKCITWSNACSSALASRRSTDLYAFPVRVESVNCSALKWSGSFYCIPFPFDVALHRDSITCRATCWPVWAARSSATRTSASCSPSTSTRLPPSERNPAHRHRSSRTRPPKRRRRRARTPSRQPPARPPMLPIRPSRSTRCPTGSRNSNASLLSSFRGLHFTRYECVWCSLVLRIYKYYYDIS